MADCFTPMDETRRSCSDRSLQGVLCSHPGDFGAPYIGNIPTTLFRISLSLSPSPPAAISMRIFVRSDDHHQAKPCSKHKARALDQATQIDPRRANSIPSTKGTLTNERCDPDRRRHKSPFCAKSLGRDLSANVLRADPKKVTGGKQ
jgi:imidazoleglycerol phosphate dehydratase HisB